MWTIFASMMCKFYLSTDTLNFSNGSIGSVSSTITSYCASSNLSLLLSFSVIYAGLETTRLSLSIGSVSGLKSVSEAMRTPTGFGASLTNHFKRMKAGLLS
jgi:hypothetical protein